MQTRITELLNIKYPIFQGGMAWVADGDLAGAVSNAGGLGIIGGGNAPKEVVKANIDRVKQITDKPFGVNIMLLSPFADDIVDLVIEEGVKVVTTGAGNPGKYMERFHEAGITVIPVIPSVALAKRMEKLGADAVVAEGMEAGGHIGKLTTMALVRQVADAVSIPVIGAGGVADGLVLDALPEHLPGGQPVALARFAHPQPLQSGSPAGLCAERLHFYLPLWGTKTALGGALFVAAGLRRCGCHLPGAARACAPGL